MMGLQLQLTDEQVQSRRAGRAAALTTLVGTVALAGLGLVATFGGETLGALWSYQGPSTQALLMVSGGVSLLATCIALWALVPRRPRVLPPVFVLLSFPPWLAALLVASATVTNAERGLELGGSSRVLASQLAEALFLRLLGGGLSAALLAGALLGLLVGVKARRPGAAESLLRTAGCCGALALALVTLSIPGFQQFSLLKDVVLTGADLDLDLDLGLGSPMAGETLAAFSLGMGTSLLAVSVAVGAWAMKGEARPLQVASGVVVAAAVVGLLSTQAELGTRVEKTVLEAPPSVQPGDDAPGQADDAPR